MPPSPTDRYFIIPTYFHGGGKKERVVVVFVVFVFE
jgi:hypothetical protein